MTSLTTTMSPASPASPVSTVSPVRAVAPGMWRLPDLPDGWAAAARSRIAGWICDGMRDPDLARLSPAELARHHHHVSFGDRDLRLSPVVQRCVTHYDGLLAGLLGADTFAGDVQIALRFPGDAGTPHLDGMYEPARIDDPPVPVAVLGIYLGPVDERCGPLAFWPGGGAAIREYGRRFRSDADPGRLRYLALMQRLTAVQPQLMTGAAGTAFVLAGSVPHCNLLHLGDQVRYALYLRLYRRRYYPRGLGPHNGGRGIGILLDAG